jgi:hypothetical protein
MEREAEGGEKREEKACGWQGRGGALGAHQGGAHGKPRQLPELNF